MATLSAELLVLRKRPATWILLAVWVALALLFAYVLPYLTVTGTATATTDVTLAPLLPARVVTTLLAGFPFFGGVFALILGVLITGSDHGWDTLKTRLVQGPTRTRVLMAKLSALGVMLVPFVAGAFLAGAAASLLIARLEAATVAWPPLADVASGFVAGWFVLTVWGAFGALLGTATRGTAMAIGIGITYAVIIEGILSAIANQVTWLANTVEYFLRANAYSLIVATGVPTTSLEDNGAGSYFGPFVTTSQASIVLATYLTILTSLNIWLLRNRDVT